jgi:hypothetical protein
VGYEAKYLNALGINVKINTTNYYQHKILLTNLDSIIDYIVLNKYRNTNVIIKSLAYVDINQLIQFKTKYGNDMFDYIIRGKHTNLIEFLLKQHSLPTTFCKNSKMINNLNLIFNTYGYHHHVTTFIDVMGSNINKLTDANIDNIFNLFIMTHVNKFSGFSMWGPGSHQSCKLNLINHYKKHVEGNWINDPKYVYEDWTHYLKNKTVAAYQIFAINASKHMKNKMVHTNGNSTYLSGTYENILIIGRLDEKCKLGISSCYIMSNESFQKKFNTFNKQLCFTFD